MGIEPTNKSFADSCLTTWLPRPVARERRGTPLGAEWGAYALVCSGILAEGEEKKKTRPSKSKHRAYAQCFCVI